MMFIIGSLTLYVSLPFFVCSYCAFIYQSLFPERVLPGDMAQNCIIHSQMTHQCVYLCCFLFCARKGGCAIIFVFINRFCVYCYHLFLFMFLHMFHTHLYVYICTMLWRCPQLNSIFIIKISN